MPADSDNVIDIRVWAAGVLDGIHERYRAPDVIPVRDLYVRTKVLSLILWVDCRIWHPSAGPAMQGVAADIFDIVVRGHSCQDGQKQMASSAAG
jgi:hypothetical protein